MLISIESIVSVSGRFSPLGFEMFSISPLQAYLFVVGVPTTPFDPSPKDALSSSFVADFVIFFSILLFLWSSFYFSLPEALRCCSFHPSFRFVKDHVLFMLIQLTGMLRHLFKFFFILWSLASLFNRSAVRICSSLFLFSNGVFSTSFISVAFFHSICSTSQASLVSLIGQRSNLVSPLLFLFRFSS